MLRSVCRFVDYICGYYGSYFELIDAMVECLSGFDRYCGLVSYWIQLYYGMHLVDLL